MRNKQMYLKVFTKKHLLIYIALIISTIFMIFLGLIQPYLMKQLLDDILTKNGIEVLRRYIVIFILYFLISQIVISIYGYLKVKLTEDILKNLRLDVYKSIVYKNIYFFNSMDTGEILSRILNELTNIITFLLDSTLRMLTVIITLIGLIIVMLNLSIKLTLIVLILAIPYVVIMAIQGPVYKRNENSVAIKYAEMNNSLHESILNIKTIKYLNIYEYAFKRVDNSFSSYKKIKLNYSKITILINILMSILAYIPYIVIIYLGFKGIYKGVTTIGTITALSTYLQQLMTQLNTSKEISIEFQQFKVLNERLEEILNEYTVKTDIKETKIIGNVNCIEIDKVILRRNDKKLFNISEKFVKGDVVLVTGDNGAGKSSFINIICGLIEPTEGSVKINNIQQMEISPMDKNKIFSISPQVLELFSGTVRENILVGREKQDDEIIELANKIGFNKIDYKFLDKEVLSRGINLSGGQIQKICILRALLNDATILIFDESSNFLDTKSKMNFYNYIEKYKENYITFIISNEMYKEFYYNKEINI